MNPPILHSTFAFLLGVLEHYVVLLLIGFAVALIAIYVNLSERITVLERKLRRQDREQAGQNLSTATAKHQPQPALIMDAHTPGAPTPTTDPWQMPSAPAVKEPFRAREPAPGAAAAPTQGTLSGVGAQTTAARQSATAQHSASAKGPLAFLLARFLVSGNWLVRSGILVLFIGVGFLLKLAAEHSLLPLELRLAGVGIAGVVLVAVGLKLTASRLAYALALQGAGVGLIYLTVYAAFALYSLLSAGSILALMWLAVLAAGWLAHRQGAQALAVLGAIGGFAAPLLASTGAGSHVLLFSYYAVLNAGVLGLAVLHTWRVLNITGFVATFVISGLWGYQFYSPANFVSVEPFLLLFFAMYFAIAIAFAGLRSLRLQDPVDSTLVFGTPLVVFGLQSRLLADTQYGLAWTAVLFAVIYTTAAALLVSRAGPRLRVLAQAFVALGIGFATLAIPLAFDARWTSASWALEGAALLWVGWRQQRRYAQLAGALLQLIAGAAWVWNAALTDDWQSSDWLGTLLLAVAGSLSAIVLCTRRDGQTSAQVPLLRSALGLWGLLWWFAGGAAQIAHLAAPASLIGALLLFIALSAAALEWLGTRFNWREARTSVLCLPVLLMLLAMDAALRVEHPLTAMATVGWPFALCTFVFILRIRDEQRDWLAEGAHLLTYWLITALLSWEFAWQSARWLPAVERWLDAAWLLVPSASIAWLLRARRHGAWPLAARGALYMGAGAMPVLTSMALGILYLCMRDPGAAWPIPYLPLFNPLDLSIVAALVVMVMWWLACREADRKGHHQLYAAIGASLLFVWLNAMLLRALFFWNQVPYDFSVQMNSTLVQASVSVLWACLALLCMVGGSRSTWRGVWMTGACLMVVVMLKLLLVDLANSGSIARIVSFICVGLLLILVGYLAPVPPRRPAQQDVPDVYAT